MHPTASTPIASSASPVAPPRISHLAGWRLHEHPVAGSTNLLAANLPAWNAVRADTQTAGRGRFQRAWVSDAGGLWLSAVVPIHPNSPASRALPLAVGLAVCDALRTVGVRHLRMRWPNDILVNDRKLAGLLIDQFTPGLAVAGIGINVRNQPESLDASLRNQTTRLSELLPNPPSLPVLTALVLCNLRSVVQELHSADFNSLFSHVNRLWDAPRSVELDLDGDIRRGTFTGVDETGRLILSDDSGVCTAFDPWRVRHLSELPIHHEHQLSTPQAR